MPAPPMLLWSMNLLNAPSGGETLGFGPIQPLLNDDSITEIMVNGPFRTYVERKGKLQLSDVTFVSDEHVSRVIERIIAPIGRRVDEAKIGRASCRERV